MPQMRIDIDPANVNTAGFASNVTGASWTLTATSSGDSLAHQVSIKNDSATDHSGKTITLVGTDADGNAQTEAVTGPAGSATVESAKYFLTLTSATPSATIGSDTMDIGWVDEVATQSYPLNRWLDTAPQVQLDFTGTMDLSFQVTLDKLDRYRQERLTQPDQNALPWIATDTSELVNATANLLAKLETGLSAFRIIANSYTDTAEVQAYVMQERF